MNTLFLLLEPHIHTPLLTKIQMFLPTVVSNAFFPRRRRASNASSIFHPIQSVQYEVNRIDCNKFRLQLRLLVFFLFIIPLQGAIYRIDFQASRSILFEKQQELNVNTDKKKAKQISIQKNWCFSGSE